MRTRLLLGGVAVVLVAILVIAGGPAEAKKPPKPPPEPPPQVDTGTIYFIHGWTFYAVNPDGSGKTEVFGCEYEDACEPSAELHYCAEHDKSERWFLRILPTGTGTYGNGKSRHDLFAVCESGGTAYQLTDAGDLEPNYGPGHDVPGDPPSRRGATEPRWCLDDTRVSYLAKRWVGNSVVEWGIYFLSVDPDNLSAHSPPAPTHVDVSLMLRQSDLWHGGQMAVYYDWKPDGTALVVQDGGLGLRRADHVSGAWSVTQLTTGSGFGDGGPRWSPVADRVLFRAIGGSIDSIDPYDPSDRTTVIAKPAKKKKGNEMDNADALWSPSGTHIAYRRFVVGTQGGQLRRATSDGGDDTELGTTVTWPHGWR